MIDPVQGTDTVKMVLRDVKVKRDKGTEESYIVTVELENGETMKAPEMDQVAKGAAALLEGVGDQQLKGKLVVKMDSRLAKVSLGYFGNDNGRVEMVVGHARVIHTVLKYETGEPYVLVQRVRFSPVDQLEFDLFIGPLLRRKDREVDVFVGPLQATIPFPKKDGKGAEAAK